MNLFWKQNKTILNYTYNPENQKKKKKKQEGRENDPDWGVKWMDITERSEQEETWQKFPQGQNDYLPILCN